MVNYSLNTFGKSHGPEKCNNCNTWEDVARIINLCKKCITENDVEIFLKKMTRDLKKFIKEPPAEKITITGSSSANTIELSWDQSKIEEKFDQLLKLREEAINGNR